MGPLRDLDGDLIRAIACVCFTDLVRECSRLGSEVVTGFSVVGCSPDDNIISQYVHQAAISRAPPQLHLMVGSLCLHPSLKRNRSRCWSWSWCCRRSWSWCCTARGWLLVEEGILLR